MRQLIFLIFLIGCSTAPASFDLIQLENAVIQEMNILRAEHGAKPLLLQAAFQDVARAHSQDMIAREYLEHVNPEGERPADRMQKAGHIYGPIMGENLHEEKRKGDESSLEIGKTTVESWLASKQGHKENMLDPAWSTTAVGVAVSESPENGRYRIVVTALYFLDQDTIDAHTALITKRDALKAQIDEMDKELAELEATIEGAGSSLNVVRRRYNALNDDRSELVEEYNALVNKITAME